MHNTTQRFQTPLELKTKLNESFGNHVPDNLENVQFGYFLQSGRAQKKWIASEVDFLIVMAPSYLQVLAAVVAVRAGGNDGLAAWPSSAPTAGRQHLGLNYSWQRAPPGTAADRQHLPQL